MQLSNLTAENFLPAQYKNPVLITSENADSETSEHTILTPIMGFNKPVAIKSNALKLSPFLLAAFFMMLLFPYMMITGNWIIAPTWQLALLYPFGVINILFIDFSLRKFYRSNRVLNIWFVEITISFCIALLLFII